MSVRQVSGRCLLFVLVAGTSPVWSQTAGSGPSANGALGRAAPLSEGWQQTQRAFDEWARIQQIYTPSQIAQMRQKLAEKAQGLSADESERLRSEVDAKLHIMMSAEALTARKWLTDTLAVASDSYAEKVRARLPDVVSETPSQLQADLDAFAARETNVKQYQEGLQQTRQMAIRTIEENTRRQAETNAQAHVGENYYPAASGAAGGAPPAYERYRAPYAPSLPFGIGYRFWW